MDVKLNWFEIEEKELFAETDYFVKKTKPKIYEIDISGNNETDIWLELKY